MSNLKEQLFEKYSKNLELVLTTTNPDAVETIKGKMLCPICLYIFSKEHLKSAQDNFLTIEHAPPQSISDECIKTLTCKKCNSEQGSKIDSHLPVNLNMRAFSKLTVGTKLKSNFTINDSVKVQGTIGIGSNKVFNLDFSKETSNPSEYERLEEILNAGESPKVDFSVRGEKRGMANLSLIRAAYLMAFSELGYAFLISNNLQPIRNQILKPEEQTLDKTTIIFGGFPDDRLGLNLVIEPHKARGYLVIMKLKSSNYRDNCGVFLPGSHDDAPEAYNILEGILSGKLKKNLKMVRVPAFDHFESAKYCLEPLKYWSAPQK